MDRDGVPASLGGLGRRLQPEVLAAVRAAFDEEQRGLLAAVPVAAADCAYGADARQRLDLYGGGDGVPVLLFVHGGGFLHGDKGGEDWANAAVGRMAARCGMVGAAMNYRLAPDHGWPAGGDDVAAAVAWLRANVAAHGGDPARIVLVGTSAGAVHVATCLQRHPELAVRGAVLLSGLYGYTPLSDRDTLYYGDHALYPERMPRGAIEATPLPLLVCCAEFDPARFQAEFLGLLQARLERQGEMPRTYVASGHNHFSIAMHLGTSDRRLENEIVDFVWSCCGESAPRALDIGSQLQA